jgi:hypothetical protein
MLCSLDELGWTRSAPDQVAVLRDVTPGDSLDNRPDWTSLVVSPLIKEEWIVSTYSLVQVVPVRSDHELERRPATT